MQYDQSPSPTLCAQTNAQPEYATLSRRSRLRLLYRLRYRRPSLVIDRANVHIYIYIYILNYKSHKRDFIKTSTVCFAFTAHQEVILNADEKLRKNARKS